MIIPTCGLDPGIGRRASDGEDARKRRPDHRSVDHCGDSPGRFIQAQSKLSATISDSVQLARMVIKAVERRG
jgi:hypothetical protein